MICKVCNSKKIKKIEVFQPYVDVEFKFEIYNCLNCQSRFAISIDLDKNKSILHSNSESPYLEHYKKAEVIKDLIDNDLNKCEDILFKNDLLLVKVLDEIEKFNNKDISILEIGCSTGYIIAFLQAKGYKNAFGIDISSEPIEYAKNLFGNFYATKEENKKYDIIFFTGVIGCVTKPMDFLNYYLNILIDRGIMLFNAPDVDSVRETNEIWVSSPPPDVIFLFEKNVFSGLLSQEYEVKSYKTFTPLNILFKYINKFRKKKNNQYPREFYVNNFKKPIIRNSILKNIIKKIAVFAVDLLVYLKILNVYSDEYGLIYKIKKREEINS